MSHVTKLSLAVGLAFAAAALNAIWLSAEKRPPTFVAARTDLAAGKEITDAMLTAVPVPGDPARLRESLIPYGNRTILFGRKAVRNYVRGDMFFQRDVQAPNEPTQYEVLGPFRLVSIGDRFRKADAPNPEKDFDPSGNNVTIAVGKDFDERTRRLLEIVDPNRRPGSANSAKIVAVQVIPKDQQTSIPAADDKNVVYQTVSLQGIENVPRVLLEGEVIRFVIPASTSL
jgi:hypothetical protein